MARFTDNKGHAWTIAITVATLKRVKVLLDVDLYEVVEGTLIEQLMRDPVFLCDVVYAVCKPEADQLGIDDEAFGAAMSGDAIDGATKALLESLVDFSPSPKIRANLKRVFAMMSDASDRVNDLIAAKLSGDELEQAIDKLLAEAKRSFGNVSGSLDSTPAP